MASMGSERTASPGALSEPDVENEQTPLLRRSSPGARSSNKPRHPLWILAITCATVTIFEFSDYLVLPPQTKIFEDIACQRYYQNSSSAAGSVGTGRNCTVDAVQSEVALVNGWKETFEQIPGMLLAFPYGLLADRIGRKPVLTLSLVGLILKDVLVKIVCWWPSVFPLRLVWACPILNVLGGGGEVASAMVWVIVADISTDRTQAFYCIFAAVLLAETLANPTAAVLMKNGPWLPFILSSVILCLSFLVSFAIPETLQVAEAKTIEADEVADIRSIPSDQNSAKLTLTQRVASSLRELATFARQGDRNFFALVFVFFVAYLGRQTGPYLLLYTHTRFGWTFGEASLLLSLRAVINLALLLAILPLVSYLFLKYGTSGRTGRDLRVSEVSSVLSTVGCILIGFAAAPPSLIFGIVIFALGTAFTVTTRSLVTSLVRPNQVGTLYTGLTIVQGAGVLIAGPMLAYTFRGGLELGEPWLGLPFLVTGGLFLLSAIAIGSVSLKGLQKASVDRISE